ncbi:DGQHR domain-containing protein [Mesorhizobium sp. NZP2077]|uniref:DGQHR domain-containing protein n=1 Tax=Mesorhizobium sp. NZP2077 TaxID=2483404 RepID=UPI00155798E0|nr:DGQHR domain-containing protein [Mesorhizobium sp. NZP2077]QKC86937.1 DGQHR domain-containing protein [Mesorhizobium sp. NZP2077]QKD20641.1 DGQHR domain-containing protein [Mesorhizobium sp. NZP2077]
MSAPLTIHCTIGASAGRQVLLGFAPAKLLHSLSFADILNEDTKTGYQRRFNSQHSLDFRRYIRQPDASTIPLTLNLRPSDTAWRLVETGQGQARLEIDPAAGKVMAQVDCQHRLGHLNDVDISLPFMCFLGLTVREEMEVFNTINSKAKGLSTSLLDFHDAHLAGDLANDRPELFIALHLNNDVESPWCRQLDLGGNSTSGLKRRASLRTMQKAIKRFLTATRILKTRSPEHAALVVLAFWKAVADVLPDQWSNHRKHILNKGVGVYALMDIAADLYNETKGVVDADRSYFVNMLADFGLHVDWSTNGQLKGVGGEGGVRKAVDYIRDVRKRAHLKVVSNG